MALVFVPWFQTNNANLGWYTTGKGNRGKPDRHTLWIPVRRRLKQALAAHLFQACAVPAIAAPEPPRIDPSQDTASSLLDGTWSGGIVRRGELFDTDGAHSSVLGMAFRTTSGTTVELVMDGVVHKGELASDGKLHWSDGDIWIRLDPEQASTQSAQNALKEKLHEAHLFEGSCSLPNEAQIKAERVQKAAGVAAPAAAAAAALRGPGRRGIVCR